MAYYRPQREMRQVALEPAATALLLIDVQNYNCDRKGALYSGISDEELRVTRPRQPTAIGRHGPADRTNPTAPSGTRL
jgi:nicotinamidase-related amidase